MGGDPDMDDVDDGPAMDDDDDDDDAIMDIPEDPKDTKPDLSSFKKCSFDDKKRRQKELLSHFSKSKGSMFASADEFSALVDDDLEDDADEDIEDDSINEEDFEDEDDEEE